MAQGDATFARGNCDWPLDPRCQGLPDNDCRWLHEVMWRTCVKERKRVIPKKYNPRWFCMAACLENELRFQSCLKNLTQAGLIGFTQSTQIVVFGVSENHPKLTWEENEDTQTIENPYLTDTGWIWVGYGFGMGGLSVTIETRQDRDNTETENILLKSEFEHKRAKPNGKQFHLPELWEQFYQKYPRHVAKEDAKKAWNQVRLSEEEFNLVMLDLNIHYRTTEIQFIPYPGKYLRQRLWNDEHTQKPKPTVPLPTPQLDKGNEFIRRCADMARRFPSMSKSDIAEKVEMEMAEAEQVRKAAAAKRRNGTEQPVAVTDILNQVTEQMGVEP